MAAVILHDPSDHGAIVDGVVQGICVAIANHELIAELLHYIAVELLRDRCLWSRVVFTREIELQIVFKLVSRHDGEDADKLVTEELPQPEFEIGFVKEIRFLSLSVQELKLAIDKSWFNGSRQLINNFFIELAQIIISYQTVMSTTSLCRIDDQLFISSITNTKGKDLILTILITMFLDQIDHALRMADISVCKQEYSFLKLSRISLKNRFQGLHHNSTTKISLKAINAFLAITQRIIVVFEWFRLWTSGFFIVLQVFEVGTKAENLEKWVVR